MRIVRSLMSALLCVLFIPAALAQSSAANTAPAKSATNKSAGSTSATDAANKNADSSSTPATCTVKPDALTSSASSASAKSGSANAAPSGASATTQINVYTTAPAKAAAPVKSTADPSKGKIFTYNKQLPAGSINAAEIASLLTGVTPGVTSVTATAPDALVFQLDSDKWVNASANTQPANQQKSKPQTAKKKSTSDLDNQVNNLAATSHVFSVNLPAGKGKACDVAHALVNTIPGILSITAVGDSQLLITSINSDNAETAAAKVLGVDPDKSEPRKQYEDLVRTTAAAIAAPAIAPSLHVDSIAQRLYYVHDPGAVAAIVNNAMPNVSAQPLLPDIVILSNSADTDETARQKAIRQALGLVVRIDQPRPQVSVNAWSMQLAADDPDGTGKAPQQIEKASAMIEQAAAEYDQAIEHTRLAGWQYLSRLLAKPDSLDPLLRDYLTYSTRIYAAEAANPAANLPKPVIKRVAVPSKVTDLTQNEDVAKQATGYGLGYSALYDPLTPNLIDMLVTLVSLNDPLRNAGPLLNAMVGDKRTKAQAMPEWANASCQKRDSLIYRASDTAEGELRKPADRSPEMLQLECLRDALTNGIFFVNEEAVSTSTLGQFRAALADFLFNNKLLIEYPDDFHTYLEPMSADTLDSAFNPLVNAFDQDISALQHDLQARIGEILKDKKKVKGYGYSGLVNVKVLGSQQGIVNTATQNYFDATPTASLNTLISNLGTQAASGASLTSLFTGISPDKAIAILTALGATLNPPKVTAHIGRELDLTVTAHTLSGAYGAELDVQINSAENGESVYTQGTSTTSDDLNSRVAAHSVNTHVRVDSLRLLQLSTMSSVLARSQPPWRPFDPYIEIPGLNMIVKHPRKAKEVYTQSLVFLDAMVVPSAADLGDGVPLTYDIGQIKLGKYKELHDLTLEGLFAERLDEYLLQYHRAITDCLSHEYIGLDYQVTGYGGKRCKFGTGDGEIDPNPLNYNAIDSGVRSHSN